MFHDLDATLRSVLADPAAPSLLRNCSVDFTTPDRDYKPAALTVNAFLHDVRENRDLRSPAPWIEADQSTVTAHRPLLRVDCGYLFTTWSEKTGAVKVSDEHRLLALALLWLGRFPVLPADRLIGSLATPAQPFPVATVVALTAEGQQMGHFWSALGIPPRPAFSLTVTIALQPDESLATFPAVHEVHVRSASLTEPRLSGRVLDAQLTPIAGAVVTVDGANPTMTTSGGDFVFVGLPFGQHILRAQAVGYPDHERSVAYAREGQIHDLLLSGP